MEDLPSNIFEKMAFKIATRDPSGCPVQCSEMTTWGNDFTSEMISLVIKCQNKTHLAHREVVLKLFPVLCESAEELIKGMSLLVLQKFEPKELEVLLKYAYFGEYIAFEDMTFLQLFKLLMTARYLQSSALEEAVRKSMWKLDEVDFLIALWDLSNMLRYGDAVNTLIDYIIKNIRKFTERFLFSRLNWRHLQTILSAAIVSEDVTVKKLYKASVQWLRVDTRARKDFISSIRHFLELKGLSPYLNCSTSQDVDLFREDFVRHKSLCHLRTDKKLPLPACFIFASRDDETMTVFTRIVNDNKWYEAAKFEISQYHFATVFHDRRLFIIGGNDNWGTGVTRCFVYHLSYQQFQPLEPLRHRRLGAGVIWHNSCIYAIGGLSRIFGNISNLDSVERLCPDAERPRWDMLAPLCQRRAFPAVVATKHYLYVIGGCTTSCERYHIANDEWSQLHPLPRKFGSSAVIATLCKNKIFVMRQQDSYELCIVDLKTLDVLVVPMYGNVPRDILACDVIGRDLWVIDPEGVLFKCNLSRLYWWKTNNEYPGDDVRLALFINFRGMEGLFRDRKVDMVCIKVPEPSAETPLLI